jgi:hypothetical protein
MPDPDFNLVARQYERILRELRDIRVMLGLLPSLRDELRLQGEQLRQARVDIARLDDSLTLNVLDRIQKLEDAGEPQDG